MKMNLMQRQVVSIIVISTFIRIVLALLLELGNDEVYYWTYARYPDFSHFDHPPMIGLLIQASTLNLLFSDDFFLRLGPIVLAACSTWMMYRIGTKVKDERAGLVAAILFTASIYCSLIAGFAVVPDAPQLFFWLLALDVMLDFLPAENIGSRQRTRMIMFGVFAGLAMLSKYHSAFLWVGVLSYILCYNRKWMKDYSLYGALAISFLLITPILYWNFTNDFITFTFHGSRVKPDFQFRPDYFIQEIAGQIAYNNPINCVLIIMALLGLARKKMLLDSSIRILLLNSLPLYFLFTGFSLFRSTLPHWTGPSFLAMIVIAAVYWSSHVVSDEKRLFLPLSIRLSLFFVLVMSCLAVYGINYVPFSFGTQTEEAHAGDGDFTQDMFGWESIGKDFQAIALKEERTGRMQPGAALISYRWYPGAHEDYYVAMHRNLYVLGELNDTHKYFWINQQRGGLQAGKDYYHIAVSNYYRDPETVFGGVFERIEPIDTINVFRSGALVRKAFVYRLRNYTGSL